MRGITKEHVAGAVYSRFGFGGEAAAGEGEQNSGADDWLGLVILTANEEE